MNSLFLLRGLPGSGKSTLAKNLSENGKYPVLCIDDFFTDDITNEYKFEFEKNHIAYKQCEDETRKQLENNCLKVFVANTFTMDWEMEPYIKMAAKYSYQLFVLTVENYHHNKNIHEISQEQIVKMAAKYKVKLY